MDRKVDASGRPFEPSAAQKKLLPDVSGNAVNGLGEAEFQRPRPVYWHHPSKIAHGPVMRWMLEKTRREVPEVDALDDKFGGRGPKEPEPIGPKQFQDSPESLTACVRDFALSHEADAVGIARYDPDWTFEGYDVDASHVVVLGIAMDQPDLARVWPRKESVVEVMKAYNRGVRAAKALAGFIRRAGWEAEGHGGPIAGPFTMIPAALAAGMGELGKHGSIINRRFGSSFRLAAVTTNLPLTADAPDVFGADDFCASCQVCARACPPDAIAHEKQIVRGAEKWYVDFDRCVPYFNETYGCGICIAVCPWSTPDTAARLAEKMARRRTRLSE